MLYNQLMHHYTRLQSVYFLLYLNCKCVSRLISKNFKIYPLVIKDKYFDIGQKQLAEEIFNKIFIQNQMVL